MRWEFVDNSDAVGVRSRETTISRIDDWWAAFSERTWDLSAAVSGPASPRLVGWLTGYLQAIDPGLRWEIGLADRGDARRLVVTPEGDYGLRPLTRTIIERAPEIPGWEILGFRPPEPYTWAAERLHARTGVRLDDYSVGIEPRPDGTLDLTFYSPDLRWGREEEARLVAHLTAEALLGESHVDRWVGGIDVEPTAALRVRRAWPGREQEVVPASRLRRVVEAAIDARDESLPEEPYVDLMEDRRWSLMELEPDPADDYPGQSDLFVARTVDFDLWCATHGPRGFAGERFSSGGETFCYLKIDMSAGLDDCALESRTAIERAVDEVLIPGALGCQHGGGSGLRYTYIDLALVEPGAALQAVRDRLREAGVPRRSWILFDDVYLCDEWIGIHPDAPPPPA